MKINPIIYMRKVARTYVVAPQGKASRDFSGMISLNGVGAFLWKQLAEDKSEQELLSATLEEYETEEAVTRADISKFLKKLKAADFLK
jgi:hypothetical protein